MQFVDGTKWNSVTYARGLLACLPRISTASSRPASSMLLLPFDSSINPQGQGHFLRLENNGRPAPAWYHQRRVPSSTTVLQIFHAAKPREPPEIYRPPRPIHLASYTANFSACLRPFVTTARATKSCPPTSTSGWQIPLLWHPPRSLLNTGLGRTTNTNTLAAPIPHA